MSIIHVLSYQFLLHEHLARLDLVVFLLPVRHVNLGKRLKLRQGGLQYGDLVHSLT